MITREEAIAAFERLGPSGRAALVATLTERIYPAYAAYAARRGFDPHEVRTMLDSVWRLASDQEGMTSAEAGVMLARCMALDPPEEPIEPGWHAAAAVTGALGQYFAHLQTGSMTDFSPPLSSPLCIGDGAVLQELCDADVLADRPVVVGELEAHPSVLAESERARRDLSDILEEIEGSQDRVDDARWHETLSGLT